MFTSRWMVFAFILVCLSLPLVSSKQQANSEEDDFAEFDAFEEEPVEMVKTNSGPSSTPVPQKPDTPAQNEKENKPKAVDNFEDEEDDDFEVIHNELEDEVEEVIKNKPESSKSFSQVHVPDYLQRKWHAYTIEMALLLGLLIYFCIYILGYSKNQNIANAWLEANRELLEENFALVGDDGKQEIKDHGLIKETGSMFVLWCSGRTLVEGLLIEMQLVKRHDLFSLLTNLVKPSEDKISFQMTLNQDSMDNFVFCIANRKTAIRLCKEMNDIVRFCPERKSAEKYGLDGDNYSLMSEIGEAASFILDNKIIALLSKNEGIIDYIHISDQFSGVRNPDETQSVTKLPQTKKVLYAGFNFDIKDFSKLDDEMERTKPLLQMVFYLLDRLKRFRLSRESKLKSEKNRQKLEKLFLQSTHLQRQELAQIKREEKRRQEKEKILQETDPEKQRKWEEKEYKREMKKKTPKMKQLRMKTA